MATFNTAFGALQTPQDVANRSMKPAAGIRLDRMVDVRSPVSLPGQQQMQAQQQAQRQKAQQPAQQMTFAQMQQSGQARPAPPPVSPGMVRQPVLLQDLSTRLSVPAIAKNASNYYPQQTFAPQRLDRQFVLANSTSVDTGTDDGEDGDDGDSGGGGSSSNPPPTFTFPVTINTGTTTTTSGDNSPPETRRTDEDPQPGTGPQVDWRTFQPIESTAFDLGLPARPRTAWPTDPVRRNRTYTPDRTPVLEGRAQREDFAAPTPTSSGYTPSQVSGLAGAVGGYRSAATAAEAARAARQQQLYNELNAFARPSEAPTYGGEEPARLGPSQVPAPAATTFDRATVAPILGAQTPEFLERLRSSMNRGVNPQLDAMLDAATRRQQAASAAAATQGMGAVPTMAAEPAPTGAGPTSIFTPEAYESTLPEGFGTPVPLPEDFPTDMNTPQFPQPVTFAQMQQAGQARPSPAPAAVQAPQVAGAAPQTGMPTPQFGGSQQAMQLRNQLQQQLQQFQQAPTRFDLPAFQQLRAAQQGMLQREFGAQRSQLEEELARRGLSASSIAAGRFGDLAGQQALAQAQIDAQLLQEAARTQAEDRANLLLQMSQAAELSGAQDLATYQAQLAGQQQQFAQGAQAGALTGQFGGVQTLEAQQLAEQQRQFDMQQQLQERLGIAGITGMLPGEGEGGGVQTLEAQRLAEQARQFDVQQQLSERLGVGELGISQQQVNIRAQEVLQQAQQAGRSLSIEEARLQAQQEQFAQNLEENRAQRLQSYNITQQQLNQEAQRIQQAERGLSLEEARDQAEIGFRAQQLMQQDRTLDIEEARLVAGSELERDKFNAQREQFRQTLDEDTRRFEQSLEEQKAQRLQNFNISQTQLDQEAYRLQQQDKTLNLQEARDKAEVSIRAQQLMQADRTLDLQEARERAQEEISVAELAEETAARLERNGISRDELNLRAEQIRYDFALRGEEIDDRKAIAEGEFQLQRERIAAEKEMQGEELDSREAQAAIEREARKYITDVTDEFNRFKVGEEGKAFDREITQRAKEIANRNELMKIELLFQLAQSLGLSPEGSGTTVNVGGTTISVGGPGDLT